MSPNPDTIARLVNAHMDAMGAAIDAAFTADAVSDTDKPASREAMHRLAASARQHLHHLAMEFAGGAAYARPEPSPQPAAPAADEWGARVGDAADPNYGRCCGICGGAVRAGARAAHGVGVCAKPAAPAADRSHVFAVRIVDEGEVSGDTCRAVTQFMEPRQPPAPSDERTVVVGGRRLRVVLRGPCYLDAPIVDAAPKAEPVAPAAVAGWVVRRVYNGHTHYAQRGGSCTNKLDEATRYTHFDAGYEAKDWRRQCAGEPGTVIEALPVDAAGNVLEERAPDVVAQCRAAEPTPAPREPDGWVVVGPLGCAYTPWLSTEADAERNARSQAAGFGPGWTARPFWLDTSPVHPSSLTDVVTTLEEERNMLRANIAALREASDVAVTVRDAEAATLRAEVKRLRERAEAAENTLALVSAELVATQRPADAITTRAENAERLPGPNGQREFLGRLVRQVWVEWAREQPDPKASWLQPWEALTEPEREVDRRIGERVASVAAPLWSDDVAALRADVDRLNGAETELRHALRTIAGHVGGVVALGASTEMHCAVADEVRLVVERLTRERDSAISLARQCREVALGERSRIAKALVADGCKLPVAVIRALPAPMLPEVP